MHTSPEPQLLGTLPLQAVTQVPSAGLHTRLPAQSAAILHCSAALQALVSYEQAPEQPSVPVLPTPRTVAQLAPPSCEPSHCSPGSLMPFPHFWQPDVWIVHAVQDRTPVAPAPSTLAQVAPPKSIPSQASPPFFFPSPQ